MHATAIAAVRSSVSLLARMFARVVGSPSPFGGRRVARGEPAEVSCACSLNP